MSLNHEVAVSKALCRVYTWYKGKGILCSPDSDLAERVIRQVNAADARVTQQALADHETSPRIDGVAGQTQSLRDNIRHGRSTCSSRAAYRGWWPMARCFLQRKERALLELSTWRSLLHPDACTKKETSANSMEEEYGPIWRAVRAT